MQSEDLSKSQLWLLAVAAGVCVANIYYSQPILPAHYAAIVDLARPEQPRLLTTLPEPVPPAGALYRSFAEKGGWSRPHNMSMLLHNPAVQPQGNLLYMAYFNAGLRIFNVANPRQPTEVGYFLPPEPTKRYGPMPQGQLVLQSEDVLVDRRGFVYLTDKNQGLWIVRYTGPVR